MRTAEIKVYKLDELPESAREKVFSDFRCSDYYAWGDDNAKTLKKFCELFGVSFSDYSYGGGNYRNIDFSIDKREISELTGARLFKYLVNNYESEIMKFDECILTGYYLDHDIMEPLFNFLKKPNLRADYYDIIEKCLYSWLKACENDYDNYYSDESIAEHFSDTEFTIDGNIF